MKHYSNEILLEYADGGADQAAAVDIGKHLSGCAACRAVVGQSLLMKKAVADFAAAGLVSGGFAGTSEQFVQSVLVRTAAKQTSRTLRAANIAVKRGKPVEFDWQTAMRSWFFPMAQVACAMLLFIAVANSADSADNLALDSDTLVADFSTADPEANPDGGDTDVDSVLLSDLEGEPAAEIFEPSIADWSSSNWSTAFGLDAGDSGQL